MTKIALKSLKVAFCSFGKDAQTQRGNIENIVEVLIQTKKYLFNEYPSITEQTSAKREMRPPKLRLKLEMNIV